MTEALARLGSERAWVVHGSDGLDEITTTGPTFVADLKDGVIATYEIAPEDAGVKRAKPEDLRGGDAVVNAGALRTLLHGRGGPYRDIVVLNAAAALVIAEKAADLKSGAALALDAIMSGKAAKVLAALVAISNGSSRHERRAGGDLRGQARDRGPAQEGDAVLRSGAHGRDRAAAARLYRQRSRRQGRRRRLRADRRDQESLAVRRIDPPRFRSGRSWRAPTPAAARPA